MKTWICSTLASFFGPMQGPARLNAYLQKDGYSISLKDFNQNAYFSLLSPGNLRQTLEVLQNNLDTFSRTAYLRENIGSILSNSSRHGINRLLENATGRKLENKDILFGLLEASDFIIGEVDKARHVLDEKFFDLPSREFLSMFRMLLCGKAIIDAAYFPAQLDMGLGFYGTAYSANSQDIIRATIDTRYNFLLPYFQNEVIPVFKEEQPGIVGISITHTSELVPAFTLARQIKSINASTHICLGGATLTEVAYRIVKNPALREFYDSLVLGPGEVAFGELIDHLESHKDLSGVPNLMYKAGETIKRSEKTLEFDINNACTPDFVSVRPGSVLPLETASGCYWGKCIFCYYPRQGSPSEDPAYDKKRVRRTDLVLQDIATLRDKYNPGFIGFTDSSLHPHRIQEIADYNVSTEKKVNFSAFIRLEKEFLSPSFCRKIAEGGFLGGQVGLESGSQRVNDIIRKGVDLQDAEAILHNFHDAGILTHVYTLIGTPGETYEDAMKTGAFLERMHEILPLGWQVYPLYVVEHGPLNERAAEFGLNVIPLPDDYLSQFTLYGVKDGLSQNESTQLSLRFSEQLRSHLHPVCDLMDIESCKIFILIQRARGVPREEIKAMS
jgi:anaerobic magnesium-protoporphyrin IX monomethyl ester cyclase